MEEEKVESMRVKRSKRLRILFILLVLLLLAFLFSLFRTVTSGRQIPASTAVIHDRSLRGDIISKDGYILSSSHKLYQATVYAKSIKPRMMGLFLRLFSIYSGIDEESLKKTFYDKNGKRKTGLITLSYSLDSRSALQLKSLARKLRKMEVFRPFKTNGGVEVLYGLDIIESGETREFPLNDCLTPIIGYVGKESTDDYVRPVGKKGIERFADKYIRYKVNGLYTGERDVVGAVIRNKNSVDIRRVDGLDVHLNIPLALQKRAEMILDIMKEDTGADEVIAAVMESGTGKILAMGSSERFHPDEFTDEDVPALNPKFAEYPYEVGSVLKPLTLAIALEHNRVTPTTVINTHNGIMAIGKNRTITDDDPFASLSVTDIIVHSSNIGISQISWKLDGQEFRKGLLDFGLSKPTGIDLTRDLPGQVKSLNLLQHPMHRANQSYGYGMHATFAQMLKAYSAFNNDGKAMSPRLIDYFQDAKGNHYTLPPSQPDIQSLSKETAKKMHDILTEVVKRGTGVAGQYKGLEIGGKTGTAHIATSRGYSNLYHSSFYGFANDNSGHKYTIGVLVIKPKKPYKYFAAQSAVPTFKKITGALVELGYLKPELNAEELAEEQLKQAAIEKKRAEAEARNSGVSTLTTPSQQNISVSQPKKEPHKTVQKTNETKPARPQTKSQKSKELFNDLDMF